MVRRWVAKSVVGFTCLGAAACQPMGGMSPGSKPDGSTATAAAPVDIGSPLYKAAAAETVAPPGGTDEAVIVPGAVIRLDKKQSVPAEVDGKIEVIGVMVGKGPIPAGSTDLMHNPVDIEQKVPEADRPYFRRLREGGRVKVGDYVCVLNDTDARVQEQAAVKVQVASGKQIDAARQATKKIEELLERFRRGGATGTVASTEILNYEAQLARFIENEMSSEKEKAKAEGDELRARTLRLRHYAQSKVNGIVVAVKRELGEYARAGETILEILSTDDVMVEGKVPAADADKVAIGMPVTIEPNTPIGPDLKFGRVSHQLEVTGLAVAGANGRPLVVSGGLEGAVIVWDIQTKAQTRLPNGSGVRSLAATAYSAGKPTVATGGMDGKVRLFDLSAPDKLADKPSKEFAEAHQAAVTAVAFSPDGKFLASAAGREVFVWDVAKGERLYALPAEHKDAVTSLRFTPQAQLVTAARDRAVRVWTLGEKAARVDRLIDHRRGTVDTLGVSSGGGRVLFDQEDGRLDVVALGTGRTVGEIKNAAAAARFGTFALFSPDDAFVLTAGGEGELQVWDTPKAGGRAAERRRLVTRDRAAPTAAAFSPDPGVKFVAVGTQAGGVQVWAEETLRNEANAAWTGQVMSLVREESATVKVRVRVTGRPTKDADTAGLLQDKGNATLLIRPGAPAATPATAAAPMVDANPVVPAGGLVLPPAAPMK